MRFPRLSLVPAALWLTLGGWLAGCSGAPRADGASAATVSIDTAGAEGGTVATCKQLTKNQVQPLIVYPITDVKISAAGTDGEGRRSTEWPAGSRQTCATPTCATRSIDRAAHRITE
ncbi:MAG TPA: hypothetical protein VJR24_12530 [Gemmatimonadaceae bacterium]|nr:hypothetical protein [Gemmatimonadaceae bacterium]